MDFENLNIVLFKACNEYQNINLKISNLNLLKSMERFFLEAEYNGLDKIFSDDHLIANRIQVIKLDCNYFNILETHSEFISNHLL